MRDGWLSETCSGYVPVHRRLHKRVNQRKRFPASLNWCSEKKADAGSNLASWYVKLIPAPGRTMGTPGHSSELAATYLSFPSRKGMVG